jgi:S-phase kinase-associated protein 1
MIFLYKPYFHISTHQMAASAGAEEVDDRVTVKLVSSDGTDVDVELNIANMSTTIANTIADVGLSELDGGISVPTVTGPILRKVIEYCNHHKGDQLSKDEDTKKTDDIEPWDLEFCNVDQATLFELIMAANYLDIKSLLDLGCKTVANMIKGKTPEQIRQTFNIKNDFTPEEEEQVKKENEWCDETPK